LAGPETAAPGATETTPAGKAGTKSTAVKLGTEFGSNFADGFSKGAVQKLNDILKDALSGHKSKFNLGKEVSSLFMSTVTSAIEKTASDYFTKQVGDFKRIVNPFQAIVDHGHQKPVVSTPSESPTTVPTNAAAGATEIEVPPDQPATTPTTPTAPASPGPTVPTNFVATATEIALPFIQDLTYKPPAAPSLTTPTFPLAMPNLPMFNGNAAKAIAWMTKAASSAGTTPGGAADIVAPLKLNVPLAMSIPTDRPVTITLIVAGGNGALSLNGALGAGLGGSSEGSGTALGQTVDGVVARSVQATDKAAAGFGKSLTKDSAKSAQSLIGAAQTIGEAGMFLTEAVSGQGKQKSAGMGGLLGMGLGLLAGSLLPGLSLLDGAGLGGTIGSLFGGLFADGGDPPVGQLSVVGEKGPELIRPRWSTTVVSNPDFRSLVSASGSVPVAAGTGGNINVHIAGGNVIREEADIHRIAKRSARLVEGAARMGVRYSGG
jgi:hypothetical protein